MQRFFLSMFTVLLATASVAPTAQALPKIDSAFDLQTLRLNELDVRNKSKEAPQPYYPQSSAQPSLQSVTTEQKSRPTTEPTLWEAPNQPKEVSSPVLSITEQRHQVLDRS